jgi:hypothetical protein
MTKLESESMSRLTDFDTNMFDMAANNCTAKPVLPTFLKRSYSPMSLSKASVKALAPSMVGKAIYEYIHDTGKTIIIDNHDVLVCSSLFSRVFSIPNWY